MAREGMFKHAIEYDSKKKKFLMNIISEYMYSEPMEENSQMTEAELYKFLERDKNYL